MIGCLILEKEVGFMLRRSILANVGGWNRFLLVESKVGPFG